MTFRILSWNINGLRSFKMSMEEFLNSLEADIICFQETKITRDMLKEPQAIVEGYSSFFSFSRKRSGYSGVATYCSRRATPTFAQEGLSGKLNGVLEGRGGEVEVLPGTWTHEELKDLDSEGRAMITQHTFKDTNGISKNVTIINVYCPRVDPEKPERRIYKLRYYELLRQRAASIRATGCHVIIVGDINTSHKRIDHCDPDETEDFENRLGRRYLDRFLKTLRKETDILSDEEERCSNDGKEKVNNVKQISPESQESGFGSSQASVYCEKKDSHCKSNKLHSLIPENNACTVGSALQQQNIGDALGKKTEILTRKQEVECDDGYGEDINDDYLLNSSTDFQVVDTFRYFYPQTENAFTCWNTHTNSRSNNYGTRIDYVFCNESLLSCVKDSQILQDVMGSDHCPVAVVMEGELVAAAKLPHTCTKFYPEFQGQQQKLSSYFKAKSSMPNFRDEREQSRQEKSENSVDRCLSSGIKRKEYELKKSSSFSSKKSCKETQQKLSSFFTKKTKEKDVQKETSNQEENFFPQSTSETARLIDTPKSERTANIYVDDKDSELNSAFVRNNVSVTLGDSSSRSKICGMESKSEQHAGWGFLMKGPKPPPLCPGHQEPSVRRTVKKKGPNMNRQFYACARGAGREGDPNAQCNFFKWA